MHYWNFPQKIFHGLQVHELKRNSTILLNFNGKQVER